MPFFVDNTVIAKAETTSTLSEKETYVLETSQPDEKQSAVSDEKPNSPEESPDVSSNQATSVPTKTDEKARQPVVLNPVPQQQVKQPQEDKLVSPADSDNEVGAVKQHLVTPQQLSTESTMQDKRIDNVNQLPVDCVVSVVPPSGNMKKRFTVKKVEDPVLNSNSFSEFKLENNETGPSPAVYADSNTGITSFAEMISDHSSNDISAQPERELKQDVSEKAVLQGKETQEIAVVTINLQQGHDDILKGDTELLTPAVSGNEQLQIKVKVQTSRTNGEQLQFESTSSSRPQTPTYAFHPLGDTISDGQSSQHHCKFESQLSGEELNPDKLKSESVASSDDELTTSVSTMKSGAPPSGSEYIQGRFIVSVSSDRPETPLSETSEPGKPPPVEITLQDVTGGVGTDSVPSLTPSSSMESLNSVGSQPGGQSAPSFSSSPHTILPEGQSSTNQASVSNKEPARKNSGQSDILNDTAKLVKQDGEQGRQSNEQVQIYTVYDYSTIISPMILLFLVHIVH